MKFIILAVVALVALASAVPVEKEPPKIISSNFDASPDGAYNFAFETENGINRNENGELKQVVDADNKPQTVVVVRGSYSYKDEFGNLETINYEADEQGYRAQGPSIPTGPVARR